MNVVSGEIREALRVAVVFALVALGEVGASSRGIAAEGDPALHGSLVLDIAGDGTITATGTLPPGLDTAAVEKVLGVDALKTDAVLAPVGGGDADLWREALEALSLVVPRIDRGRIRVRTGLVTLKGRLRPGFSLRGARSALRAALGSKWRLDFALAETPPPAVLGFEHDARGTRLSGLLPAGMSAARVLTVLDPAEEVRLGTGGTGDPAVWGPALVTLDTLLSAYDRAEGTIAAGRLVVTGGQLAPGQDVDRLEDWADKQLGADWDVDLAGTATPAADGATRFDPATRGTQRLTDGRWLRVFEFAPGPERCDDAARAARASGRLRFETGSRRLSAEAAPVLDRLAALALHCLEDPDLRLEIGGHTDSVGGAEANRALSLSRAEAVRDALIRRGVPEAAVTARGYGADRPIADNATSAGRSKNRRITFAWHEGDAGEEAHASQQ